MAVRRPVQIDEEEMTTTAKSRSPWDNPDEEDRPRRSTRLAGAERDTEPDDAEYESPRSSRVRRGWEETERGMDGGDRSGYSEPENFLLSYRASNQPRLIRFLDNSPMFIKRHYWDRGTKGYFVCLEDDCPMCDAGNTARGAGVFTVIDMTPEDSDDPPHRRFLYAGKRLLGQLRDRDDDPKYGPLTKSYLAISKSGEGKDTTYQVTFVKDRDLEDDWEMTADEAEEISSSFKAAGEEKLGIKTRRELREIVQG